MFENDHAFDLKVDLSVNVDGTLFTSSVALIDLPNVVQVLSRFGFCLVISPVH